MTSASSPVKLELVGRPSLMLPPSFAAIEEEGGIGISKMEYNFYSPLKKTKGDKWYYKINSPPLKEDMVKDQDLVRFHSSGSKEEVALMQDKDTTWVGSSHGWLALFNKNNRSMSLINPVSGRSIPLPPFPFRKCQDPPVKVILSHSPDDENSRALAIHGNIDDRAAAVCSPGRSDRWSPLALGRGCRYNDFVYSASRKAFVSSKRVSSGWLCLGLGQPTDELEFWDVESTMEAPVKTLRAPPVDTGRDWQTYLVPEEESGQVFMVRRYHDLGNEKRRVRYNVYSIESYVGITWEVVQLRSSLDDLVMFIGMNHSFAVKASRFPEYRPNCIYFSGGWSWKYGKQNKPFADVHDYKTALYYYSDRYYSQLFYGNDFPFDHNLPWFTLTKD